MLLEPRDNLLLYGLTGSGKTTQLAELIKALTKETGKKALVYVTDGGGRGPLENCAELEEFRYGADPFVWIDQAVQGKRFVNGKWVAESLEKCCLVGMESLSGMGDHVLQGLGRQAADGKSIGGEPAPALQIHAEGQTIRVASGSRSHYLVAQKHLLEKVWQSQLLPCPVVWTAHEDVGDAENLAAAPGVKGIIGPLVAGHALTTGLPKYFVYTFRLKVEVAATGKTHILYTERHKDGLYEGLANNRAPLKSSTKVPGKVSPADVVQVLHTIRQARAEERQALGGAVYA